MATEIPANSSIKILELTLLDLHISHQRRKNLLCRLWTFKRFSYLVENKSIKHAKPGLLRSLKNLMLQDVDIFEMLPRERRQTAGVFRDLRLIHHRDWERFSSDEDSGEYRSQDDTDIPLRTFSIKSKPTEIGLFPFPNGYEICPSSPVSGYLLPFSLRYLRNESLRLFFLQSYAKFSLAISSSEYIPRESLEQRFFCLRNDFLFEFKARDDIEQGKLPIGVISLHQIQHIELSEDYTCACFQLNPAFIDCKEPDLYPSNSLKHNASYDRLNLKKQGLGHFVQSCDNDLYKLVHKMKVRPKYVWLHSLSDSPDENIELLKLLEHIERFKANDREKIDRLYARRQRPIGRGKFSCVFEAKRRQECVKCALKVVKKSEYWDLVESRNERADTLSKELAINIFLSFEIFRQRDVPVTQFLPLRNVLETSNHLVMEFDLMGSKDLFQVLAVVGHLKEREARRIIQQLATAIQFLQSNRIAHRDLKLSNVVLKDYNHSGEALDLGTCECKLIDFGLATLEDESGFLHGKCGTPGYIAPEILLSRLYYKNTVDLFSLGVVTYMLLSGTEPFSGETEEELIMSNKLCHVRFEESNWANVSSDAREIILMMLEKDPEKRATVEEVLSHRWITGNSDFWFCSVS